MHCIAGQYRHCAYRHIPAFLPLYSKNNIVAGAVRKVINVAEVISLCKINLQIFAGKFGRILTDEVIITNERIEHIKTHHPEDFGLFQLYGKDCVQYPDLVLTDKKNFGTVFMIKKLSDINLNIVLRLVLENEDNRLKNSVMTFWRIRERNLKKLIKRNEILYKKE